MYNQKKFPLKPPKENLVHGAEKEARRTFLSPWMHRLVAVTRFRDLRGRIVESWILGRENGISVTSNQ